MTRALPALGLFVVLVVSSALQARAADAIIHRDGDRFTLQTARVQRILRFADGRLLQERNRDLTTGRDLVNVAGGVEDFSLQVDSHTIGGATGGWTLQDTRQTSLSQGEQQLDLTLARPGLRISRSYIIYPGSSIIRECTRIANTGNAPVTVADPAFLCTSLRVDEPASVDFHWMTGAHNLPGLWTLRTEALPADRPRGFDSYDPYPHVPNSPRGFKPGSASYAPWYALYGRDTHQGLFITFDYFGHWASSFQRLSDGAIAIHLRLSGFRRVLKPGESIATPWALIGLYHDDLDNAGNELLDWQYAYLWDYTRDGRNGSLAWFPALRTLGYWYKGTGWGKPGVTWTGGHPDIPSTFRKVFRVADYMRSTGTDVYHRDWGWWDIAGEWNGPDFGATGRYLRKYGMGQLIYAFLYTVNSTSAVARQHPDWVARSGEGWMTLDLSRPEVVQFIEAQLDRFVERFGDFEWRNDSDMTGQRDSDPSSLLEQDQNFRRILQHFLDKYPNCAFQAVNGGGNYAGCGYVRFASNIQFSDGAIGALRNYYSSLLFPPDKNCDNPDQWNPDKYDKSVWRGLLSFNYDTTGDTIDPAKIEGIRQLNDIYHYLLSNGVVGRWVHVYRPRVTGDDPTMWFQRLSRDGQRGIIIPKHVPAGPVTVYPKGLLPSQSYTLSYQESDTTQQRSGADLMEHGITFHKMPPGELIYLNLPLHPGSRLDKIPPSPPTPGNLAAAENMGYPGVELTWKPGNDDNWVSCYELFRNGVLIDKIAKGTYYFDHSVGADPHARYELRTVDGAGNVSPRVAFTPAPGQPATVMDDAPGAGITFTGPWKRVAEPPAHAGTLTASPDKSAIATFTVTGRQVLIFSRLGADCGRFSVSVDGQPPETVDTFSADDIWGVCVWKHALAGDREHRIELHVLGEKGPLSTGTKVYIDGVRAEH